MDWCDLPAVQGTLRSLLQYHSSKASILQCSAFFIVELSYPYMTMGKTIALTRQTFVGKIMFLLFNSFSSKEQASFHFMAAITICSDFGAPKNKACHCFHCFPIYLPWSDGTGCHDFTFLYILFHYCLSQNIEYSSLCYTVGPCLIILNLCSSQTPIPSLSSLSSLLAITSLLS